MAARSAVMVGRDPELARLLESVRLADAGQAQVVVVGGEAGIGKTRLVRALAEELAAEEAVVAFGHAVPLAGGVLPYGVTGDLLRSLVREVHLGAVQEALGARAELLAPLVPKLAAGHEAALDRPAVYAASQDLIADLSCDRMLLLVLEDLHWADDASLDLLVFWARTLVRGRLVLVATTRDRGVPDDVLARLGELRRLPNATTFDLTPLSTGDVEAQLRALGVVVGEAQMAEIQRLSDGNPLFVEELVAGGVGGPSPHLALDLAGRVSGLSIETAEVVRLASLEPRPFVADNLAAVANRGCASVVSCLDEGRSAGIVERGADAGWRFHHELIRLAVSRSGPTTFRDEGHRAWGRVLSGPDADAGDLISAADHYEAAGALRESASARSRGARAARDSLGHRAASWEWKRILELLGSDAEAVDEDVHEEALLGAGADELVPAEYLRVLLLEEAIAGPRGPVLRAWRILERYYLSRVMKDVHSPDLSVAEVLDLQDGLLAEGDRRAVLKTLSTVVGVLGMLGAEAERDWLIDRLEEMSATKDGADTAMMVMEWRLMAAAARGSSADEQHAIIARVLPRLPELSTEARARVGLRRSELLQRQGDLRGAMSEAEEISRSLHGPQVGGYIWTTVEALALELCWLLGLWDQVVTRGELLMADLEQIESHNTAVTTIALVQLARGAEADARHTRPHLLPIIAPGRDGSTGYESRNLAAMLDAALAAGSDVAGARAALAAFLAEEADDLRGHLMLGELVLQCASLAPGGEPTFVRQVERAVALLEGEPGLGAAYRRHAEAHLAEADGRDTAPDWSEVADSWAAMGVPFHAARARLGLARALVRDGDRDAATDPLVAALTAAEGLPAQPLADEIRSFAVRARLRLPGLETPEQIPSGGLTAREREVLQLLAQGMTNDQIGTALFMSPRTASVHVSRILGKLGAANRTEVAAIAHRRGLID